MIENLRVLRYFVEAKGIRRISILESEEYWNIEIKLEFESIFFFLYFAKLKIGYIFPLKIDGRQLGLKFNRKIEIWHKIKVI